MVLNLAQLCVRRYAVTLSTCHNKLLHMDVSGIALVMVEYLIRLLFFYGPNSNKSGSRLFNPLSCWMATTTLHKLSYHSTYLPDTSN